MTTTPEREALAAAFDRLHDEGFQRQEDWFVKNAGEEFMEQIHVDTIAALAASPAAGVLRPLKFDEEAAIDAELTRRGDDEGQGLDNYWKKAFREGWRARAMLAATPQAAPAPQPASGWSVTTTDTDGRVYLHLKNPVGQSGVLSAANTTLAAKVAVQFAEEFQPTVQAEAAALTEEAVDAVWQGIMGHEYPNDRAVRHELVRRCLAAVTQPAAPDGYVMALQEPEAPASAPASDDVMLDCEIAPMALPYPLSDYHRAMTDGPLNQTWTDKPHRLVYDLIAAVRYYAAPASDEREALTDDEWQEIADELDSVIFSRFKQAVNAKLVARAATLVSQEGAAK